MKRKKQYQRLLAIVLCTVMTVAPITALAGSPLNDSDEVSMPVFATLSGGETAVPGAGGEEEEIVLTEDNGEELEEEPGEGQSESEDGEAPIPAEEPQQVFVAADPNAVTIVYNGAQLELETYARTIDGVTYVPLRGFFEALGCTVGWNAAKKAITVTLGSELNADFQVGSQLVNANGRSFYMDQPCRTVADSAMIPLRAAARIFTCEVMWDAASRTVTLTGGAVLESGETFYDADELLWLTRIVYHEAGNQKLDGKVAVANVVLNRKASDLFPNTVYDVIYDTHSGVQFITKSDKSIFRTPTAECELAAKLAIEGYITAPNCLFFATRRAHQYCWASRHRQVYAVIGDHVFYL
ncbi:MAG: cell wall hydrolase [Clostridia bacterium]|nr:cell wall hydrolase [Clostridia bacterium]